MTTPIHSAAHAGGEQHGCLTDDSGGFANVLVGVDGTSTGRDAIALADRLRGAAGRLTLAHVVPDGDSDNRGPGARAWKRARETLEREREAAGVSARLA
ncbi:MAG: universal stress protein, partial [Trebonia sp.]